MGKAKSRRGMSITIDSDVFEILKGYSKAIRKTKSKIIEDVLRDFLIAKPREARKVQARHPDSTFDVVQN
jgi:predicted transcriptional regulator|tara:strand:+ start:262 stop:471 length:210 start_codon:yes stop_codon:yes gene_type:complete